jgi:hypothetical protein
VDINENFVYYLPFVKGTLVDFLLIPHPSLLVHVVIECP